MAEDMGPNSLWAAIFQLHLCVGLDDPARRLSLDGHWKEGRGASHSVLCYPVYCLQSSRGSGQRKAISSWHWPFGFLNDSDTLDSE